MKNVILFFAFTYAMIPSANLHAQPTSDTSVTKVLENFLQEVQAVRAETKARVEKLEGSISHITNSNGEIEILKDKVTKLEDEVQKIKSIDSIINESKSKLIQKKYNLATGLILDEIIDGVIYVRGLSEFVQIEQNINIVTNPWYDKDIRDGYDRLKDWTAAFGIVGGGIPLLNKNSDPKGAIFAGLGAMLVPQIISWIGKKSPATQTSASKIKSKVEFLNVSRHAYDDLYQRKLEIREIYKEDSLFLVDLRKFRNELNYGTLTDSLMNERIFKVQNIYNKFTNIQYQIPKYLYWTKTTISKYKEHQEIYDKIKDIETKINSFLTGFSEDFNELANIPIAIRRELFSSN